MGEEFSGQTRGMKLSLSMLHPKVLLRLLRAWLRSKMEKREILPKDLWPAKAIMTGGLDTAIYRNDIAYYWANNRGSSMLAPSLLLLQFKAGIRRGWYFSQI
jgi:hypothetical protein